MIFSIPQKAYLDIMIRRLKIHSKKVESHMSYTDFISMCVLHVVFMSEVRNFGWIHWAQVFLLQLMYDSKTLFC